MDNICSGGCIFEVDKEEGIVVGYGRDYAGNKYIRTPTDIMIIGFKIPFWSEARTMVLKAANKYPDARMIGWDVAITPTGPVLIEANMLTSPIVVQFNPYCGIWNYLKEQK